MGCVFRMQKRFTLMLPVNGSLRTEGDRKTYRNLVMNERKGDAEVGKTWSDLKCSPRTHLNGRSLSVAMLPKEWERGDLIVDSSLPSSYSSTFNSLDCLFLVSLKFVCPVGSSKRFSSCANRFSLLC